PGNESSWDIPIGGRLAGGDPPAEERGAEPATADALIVTSRATATAGANLTFNGAQPRSDLANRASPTPSAGLSLRIVRWAPLPEICAPFSPRPRHPVRHPRSTRTLEIRAGTVRLPLQETHCQRAPGPAEQD